MAVLNCQEIKHRIRDEQDYDKKLLVTPVLCEDQIGPASVDIRLGSSIVVSRKTYVAALDVTKQQTEPEVEKRLYERIRLRYFKPFVLHPNEVILAGMFEYLSLPDDLFATVASKSSWGRLGLVIATASIVQPGFRGSLTLELCNLGESPITLYPGLLIGQLVFYDVKGPRGERYGGKYSCPTEAEPPSFAGTSADEEMAFWREGPRQV